MAGQTINDRLLAARHSIAGQGLAKSVCKASTEEMIGPKKKHLDYLVHCTNEPNVSIPHLANLLIERSQNTNWVVVYKVLITVHHLLAYGNERFMQYLASSNSSFNLNNFLDRGGVQEIIKQSITLNKGPSDFSGTVGARIGYDMSPFIRRYAKYLNEKALSYRTVAFDFCKVKRGKEEGSLRTMNADKLLKTLPVLQAQLDGLLEFDCSANDLTNGVINMCFMLLFRDLIRLFACYNDGIINLLEKYFDMNKKQCRDALDLYKKFLVRMDRVGEFLKVAENVGIDKGDIPDLTKAPSSLLDALEQHLAALEGKKGSAANTPTQSASNQKNVKSGVSALSSTSSSFGTAANSTRFDNHANGIDESVKAQALAEEEAAMNQYKSKLSSPTNSCGGGAALTNPFLSSPPATQTNAPIVDLFGSPNNGKAADPANAISTKASDDLLQLGNPFADMFGAPAPAQIGQPAVASTGANNMWMSNGFNGSTNIVTAASTTSNTFVSDSNFSSVFGSTEPTNYYQVTTMYNNEGQYYLQAATDETPNPFLFSDSDEIGSVQASQQIQQQHQQQLQSLQQQQHQQQQQQGQQQQLQDFQLEFTGEVEQQQEPQKVDGSSGGTVKPSRPPPPQIGATSSPATSSSPAKTAFDELNDSILLAFGSPAKSSVDSASSSNVGVVGGVSEQPTPVVQQQSMQMSTSAMLYQQQQYPQMLPQQQQQQQQQPKSMPMGISPVAVHGFGIPQQQHQQQTAFMSSPVKQPLVGGFDALGDVLKPASSAASVGSAASTIQTGNVLASGVQQQVQQQQQQQPAQHSTGKILTGDLDSSLASLVDNLNINKSGSAKGVQWNSPKNTAKPGANWTPQPMAATTGVGYRPMAQGMTVSPAPSTISPFVHASYPVLPNYMQQGMPQMQPMMGSAMPGGVPMMAAQGMMPMSGAPQQGMQGMMAMPSTGTNSSAVGQPVTGMMMSQQKTVVTTTGAQPSPAQNGNKNVQLDPFGAL